MKTTSYFMNSVMSRRPYLRIEWIEYVINNPIATEIQENGRIRRWAFILEIGKYLRVVTEPDGETIHSVFPDRGFTPEKNRDFPILSRHRYALHQIYYQHEYGIRGSCAGHCA